jgi:hypothetical protein
LVDSVDLQRELGQRRDAAISLTWLGKIAYAAGDEAAARAAYAESLPVHQRFENRWGIAVALEGCAALASQSQPASALRLAGAAAALRRAIGRPLPPAEQPVYERWLATARAALAAEAAAAAWTAGESLSLEAAITLALDLAGEPHT